MKMVSLNTGSFPIRKSERGDLKNFWVWTMEGIYTFFPRVIMAVLFCIGKR
ncbi:hypothetical protein [Massilioclostridium coli]|uniref:hypothetical protein n=1 Tax=Massilioclostridium coli TaxID=1870991 RepID=UPI0013563F67|nr:hypothetical protein [Massilioclostridium coli]